MTGFPDFSYLDDTRRLKIAKIRALVNNGFPASVANCLGGALAFYVATVVSGGIWPWITLSLHLTAAAVEFLGSSRIKSSLLNDQTDDASIRHYEWQLILQRGFFALGWGIYGAVYFDPASQDVTLLILACVLTFAVSASAYGGYNLVTLINGRALAIGPIMIASIIALPPQWLIYTLVCLTGMALGLLIGLNVDRTFTRAFENRLKAERAAAALDVAKGELESALSFGHRMIDIICHDLQQPLKALDLYAHQLLESGQIEDGVDRIRLREGIQHSTDNVSRLVRQLSDAQRARGNEFQPVFSPVSINELFSRLAFDFEPIAQREKIDLRFVECSLMVHADKALLERVLRNLIDNAIKHGQNLGKTDSRVLVGCRRSPDHVAIWVVDQGPGIKREDIDTIFDPYNQLNPTKPGLGLGLFIAKRLGDAMDAELQVCSRVGFGTVFSIKLKKAYEIVAQDRKA